MPRYLLRRVLLFLPTLFLISLLAFGMSVSTPDDPVVRLMMAQGQDDPRMSASAVLKAKEQKRHTLGLDRPAFYVSLRTLADADTLYRVGDKKIESALGRLSRESGNPDAVMRYYVSIKQLLSAQDSLLHRLPDTLIDPVLTSQQEASNLLTTTDRRNILLTLNSLKRLQDSNISLRPLAARLAKVNSVEAAIWQNISSWKQYIPVLGFNGLNNQYHHWISGILFRGDFGLSYRDGLPVSDHIRDRIGWSFSLALLSVLLAYGISLPLGLLMAYYRGRPAERATTLMLYALYAIPNFFGGSMLVLMFANADVLQWLPASGVQDSGVFDTAWPWYKKLLHHLPYLILPVLTYTYSSWAFLSRHTRTGLISELDKDYIRTARAKGLSEWKVLSSHALRNALLPLITVLAHVLPAAVGGSVIVETIFAIPGMGREIFEAIQSYDYPVIIAVFTIFGFMTLLGYLLSDLLYAWADPRIKYGRDGR